MNEKEAIEKVVEVCGGQTGLVRKLAQLDPPVIVKQPVVSGWINRDRIVGRDYAIPCWLACDGAVSLHFLRPDLYPTEIIDVKDIKLISQQA